MMRYAPGSARHAVGAAASSILLWLVVLALDSKQRGLNQQVAAEFARGYTEAGAYLGVPHYAG
jgi:hypothetical protein